MLWIIGTSVSIEEGGYTTRLASLLHAGSGISLTNLSVGDQTSLMGCMRVMAHRSEFAPGDVAVWEYSLLDTLCGSLFPRSDVRDARRLAWTCLLDRGVHLIVLLTPPRQHLHQRSREESQSADDAALLGIPCIDGRDLFARSDMADRSAHYRDDRHPRQDSPFVERMAARVFDAVVALHGHARSATAVDHMTGWRSCIPSSWRWTDAAAAAGHAPTSSFSNSLTSIESVTLGVDARIRIPAARRIVGIGIVSTHASGGLWCGHRRCAAVSTRLPEDLGYPFLLRSTTLPCLEARTDTLVSASAAAFRGRAYAAYGQSRCRAAGPVHAFGWLYEPTDDESLTVRDRLIRYLDRRDELRFLRPDTGAERAARRLRVYARRLLRR